MSLTMSTLLPLSLFLQRNSDADIFDGVVARTPPKTLHLLYIGLTNSEAVLWILDF